MPKTAIISTVCPDRVGLIAAITGRLFDLGANLGETTFSSLGRAAELTAVSDFPDDIDLETIKQELQSLEELKDAESISVSWYDGAAEQGPGTTITHRITVSGGDRPGLVARLCEVFIQYEANIVRLNSEQNPGPNGDVLYAVRIDAWIPEDNIDKCLNTVANTAGELHLDHSVIEV